MEHLFVYNDLPVHIFLNIIEFLDFKDLISCSKVCRNWYSYSLIESKWKKLCLKYWALKRCPENISWRELFFEKYSKFAKYINIYGKIANSWNEIETFTQIHYPQIYQSLYEGLFEEDLSNFELKYNIQIPLDLRCAYRFHGGQNFNLDHDGPNVSEWPNPGIFGSVQNYDYFRTNVFVPPTICPSSQNQVMILTDCPYTGFQQYIAVKDINNIKCGQIFCLPSLESFENNTNSFFIIANSFSEYFMDFSLKLSSDYFPSERGHIYRFYKEPKCEVLSNNVKIEVATTFLPEFSSIDPEKYTFAYRILMSMDNSVEYRHSCKLSYRHWKIIDETGNEENVDGPGVIGLYPAMEPGSKFSYISCTNFKTKSGKMFGTFECTLFENPYCQITLTVPEFKMIALPFVKNE